MSYPPPPGSTSQPASGRSTPQTHSLPARPPPPSGATQHASAFKPRSVASTVAPSSASPAHSYNSYNASAAAYPGATPTPSYYPSAASTTPYYDAAAPQSYNPAAYAPQGQAHAQAQFEPTPPQIRNPFAPPSQSHGHGGSLYGNDYDPDFQAQLQQWQSAYGGKNDGGKDLGRSGQGQGMASAGGANKIPLANNRMESSATTASDVKAVPAEAGKEKTVARSGGGQTWEDPTLLEWGNHHRLFIGNLAGEVTDESLLKAFAKYPSVQKARVVRDKRTTKSKGFGFVSLADADEYFSAAKEMQGKYIGSHPVLIRRAEAEIKAVTKKDNGGRYGKNKGRGGDANGKKDKDALSANTAGGVKKQGKQDGKYKMLG